MSQATGLNTIPLKPLGSASNADEPGLEIRVGGIAITGLALVGLIWASFAHLDAAVTAQGVVRVAGERQAIQSLDGGIVSALWVHEGQMVKRGEALADFADGSAVAQERALAVRAIDLQAEIARLNAENAGLSEFADPADFRDLQGSDRLEADRAMVSARIQLNADLEMHRSQGAILEQKVRQIGLQVESVSRQYHANEKQSSLLGQELTSLNSLLSKGFVPRNRVLEMERNAAALEGTSGAETAEIARLTNTAGEARLDLLQVRQQESSRRADALHTAATDLQAVLPQWHAARDALNRTRVTAPMAGSVMGMTVHGVGAVVGPGQKLMEIVPVDKELVVEAQIGTQDAGQMVVGQRVQIRIAGVGGRSAPLLSGSVQTVSADSFSDEHSGRPYYTATFAVPATELARFRQETGSTTGLRPGAPIIIEVPLRSRTALQFWFEPLTQALHGVAHES